MICIDNHHSRLLGLPKWFWQWLGLRVQATYCYRSIMNHCHQLASKKFSSHLAVCCKSTRPKAFYKLYRIALQSTKFQNLYSLPRTHCLWACVRLFSPGYGGLVNDRCTDPLCFLLQSMHDSDTIAHLKLGVISYTMYISILKKIECHIMLALLWRNVYC